MYELQYLPAAQRYFKKIKERGLKNAFRNALSRISADPYIGKMKTADLTGLYGYDVYYNKTNYEISYRIYEEKNKKIAAPKSKSSDKKEMQDKVSDKKNYQKPRRVTDPEELEIINYLLQQDGADLSGRFF